MNETDHLNLMLNAWTEIIQEEKGKQEAPLAQPVPDLPTLSQVFTRLTPLPDGAVFLGMANDGLPVLLNLYDPVPGPILIAGDPATGKTRLLQTVARAAEMLHVPASVQYGVVTTKPYEWESFYGSENNVGIYQTKDESTTELLQSLVTWAHNNKGEDQSILVLIDDLYAVSKLNEQTRQNLRWLLLRGPSRRIWTFATMDSNHADAQTEWLEFFRTRLFGNVEDVNLAILLTGNSRLNHLAKGNEFAMREQDKLLKFWLPVLD